MKSLTQKINEEEEIASCWTFFRMFKNEHNYFKVGEMQRLIFGFVLALLLSLTLLCVCSSI